MRYPGPVVTGIDLSQFVLSYFVERAFVGSHIVLDRYLCSHPAHGVDPAPVTCLYQERHIGGEEIAIHRHRRTVGQDELSPVAKLFDKAENVIPPPAIEPRRVISQLIQYLV